MTKTTRCELCSRVLTDEASVARRIGPECEGKLAAQLNAVATAVSALANGHRDPLLKRSLELLSVATASTTTASDTPIPGGELRFNRTIQSARAATLTGT
jgi:hypothetical protein